MGWSLGWDCQLENRSGREGRWERAETTGQKAEDKGAGSHKVFKQESGVSGKNDDARIPRSDRHDRDGIYTAVYMSKTYTSCVTSFE